jgi:hypothetical protein
MSDPHAVKFVDGKPQRLDMSRMFMVHTPSGQPVYWTASRKAFGSVSTIAFKYGKTWEEMVAEGYSLRKIFYNAINVTYRTFNTKMGPARKSEVLAE